MRLTQPCLNKQTNKEIYSNNKEFCFVVFIWNSSGKVQLGIIDRWWNQRREHKTYKECEMDQLCLRPVLPCHCCLVFYLQMSFLFRLVCTAENGFPEILCFHISTIQPFICPPSPYLLSTIPPWVTNSSGQLLFRESGLITHSVTEFHTYMPFLHIPHSPKWSWWSCSPLLILFYSEKCHMDMEHKHLSV